MGKRPLSPPTCQFSSLKAGPPVAVDVPDQGEVSTLDASGASGGSSSSSAGSSVASPAGWQVEARALWKRIHDLELENMLLLEDIHWLFQFADHAQHRFRVIRPRTGPFMFICTVGNGNVGKG